MVIKGVVEIWFLHENVSLLKYSRITDLAIDQDSS